MICNVGLASINYIGYNLKSIMNNIFMNDKDRYYVIFQYLSLDINLSMNINVKWSFVGHG